MKQNRVLLAIRKSALVSVAVFLLLFVFYSFTGLSSFQGMIAEGKEISVIQTPLQYWIRFMVSGDLFSVVYHRPVLQILFSSFLVTFFFSLAAFVFSMVWGIAVIAFVVRCRNFETVKKIRKTVLIMNGFPSSVFILLCILIFSFGLNWFPSSYQTKLLSVQMLFPVVILSFLFSFTVLFYSFTRLSLVRIDELQFQLRLHKFGIWTKIRFLFNAERELVKYIVMVFIPVILKGSVFAEILFSIPGISRVLFDSMKNHDFPMVMTSFPIVAFIYSFFFFMNFSPKSRGLNFV